MRTLEFGISPERDEEWHRECWRETVRAVLVTEQRAFPTNLLTIAAIAIAASFLQHASAFVWPIIMRVLAAIGAHLSYGHLRRRLDLGQDLTPPLRLLAVMLFFGGMSWGYLLLPLLLEPHIHPISQILVGGILVGVALIVSMTVSLRAQAMSFVGGFMTILFFGLWFVRPSFFWPSVICFAALMIGICLFAFANMRQREFSSEMLVENRRLNEDLAEALAQSEFLAKHDPMTGLYNRRALFEGEIAHQANEGHMQLLLIDLDNFKALNDSFGHDAGDRTLIATSNLMRDAMRGHGEGGHFAVRLGGEEFALFLDEKCEERAMVFAEDLREAISELHEVLNLPAGATSASIGIARHTCGEPVEQAIGRADKAMYDAKAGGRNRVRRNHR